MLYTTTEQNISKSYLDLEPSWWMTQKAAFMQAYEDNPTYKAVEYWGFLDAEDEDQPKLTREEVYKQTALAGVTLSQLPKDGVNKDQLKILIDRQKRIRDRAKILEAGGVGFTGMFLPALAGSLADPLFVATDLGVSAGLGAAARLRRAKRATDVLSRARRGAVEGAIAGTLTEPVSYGLSQALGDNYTLSDSALNIAMGTAMGAILHPVFGGIGDYVKGRMKVADSPVKELTPKDAPPNFFNQLDKVDQEIKKVKSNIGTLKTPSAGQKGKLDVLLDYRNTLLKNAGITDEASLKKFRSDLEAHPTIKQAVKDGSLKVTEQFSPIVQAMHTPQAIRMDYLASAKNLMYQDIDVDLKHTSDAHIKDAYVRFTELEEQITSVRNSLADDASNLGLNYRDEVARLADLEKRREDIITEIDGTTVRDTKISKAVGETPEKLRDYLKDSVVGGANVVYPGGRVMAVSDNFIHLDTGRDIPIEEAFSNKNKIFISEQSQPRTPRPDITNVSPIEGKSIFEDKDAEDSAQRDIDRAGVREDQLSEDIESAKVYDEKLYESSELDSLVESEKLARRKVSQADQLWRCLKGG